MTKISKNIKKFRKQQHLTQEQLAEQMHLTRQAISNWENDKSQPDINSVAQMADIFHISVEELIYGSLKKVGTEENTENKINVMKIVLSVFGGLFCAAGLILLFVAFWQDFPSFIQGILSVIPLLAGLALVIFVYKNKADNAVWREIAGIVWCVGVCASIALLNNSTDLFYNDEYMLPCCLLCLPVMFLFNSIALLPVFYLFEILFGISSDWAPWWSDLNFAMRLMLAFFAVGIYYTHRFKKDGNDGKYQFAVWMSAIAGIANCFIFFYHISESSLLLYYLFLISYCIIGKKEEKTFLPFRILGTLGVCILSLVSTALVDYLGIYYTEEIPKISKILADADIARCILALVTLAITVAFLVKSIRFAKPEYRLGLSDILLFAAVAADVCISVLVQFRTGSSDTAQILILVAAAVIGVAFILTGINKLALFELNVGIITVFIAFIILTSGIIDFSLFTVGGLFLLFGTAMFFANAMVSKKKKALASAQDKAQEE